MPARTLLRGRAPIQFLKLRNQQFRQAQTKSRKTKNHTTARTHMKKLIVALTTALACVAAFAQGKISFQNDTVHLAYYSSTSPTDSALQGQGVFAGAGMPVGDTLVADLYMGTDPNNLQLYTTTSFGGTPGKWNAVNVSSGFPGATPPGGAHVNIMTIIRDSSFTPPNTISNGVAAPYGTYFGESVEFQFTLGSSFTYPQMWSASGNWPAGSQDMSALYGAGAKGAIAVAPVPEPTSFALAGLGAAALLIFRRRK